MTTESRVESLEASRRQLRREMSVEGRKWARQNHDNLGYSLEIWDGLVEDHPGNWAVFWGNRQLLIGDDVQKMIGTLAEDEARECLARFIAPLPDFI